MQGNVKKTSLLVGLGALIIAGAITLPASAQQPDGAQVATKPDSKPEKMAAPGARPAGNKGAVKVAARQHKEAAPAKTDEAPAAQESHAALEVGKPQDETAPADPMQAPPRKIAKKPAVRYFIDFRSRFALSYGHTFSVYGKLDARGKIIESTVAGLHPAGDSPAPWMVGHLVFVPSETGASDGDTEDEYISASYRVMLSEAEYIRVVDYIKKLQAGSPVWHAMFYNCNAFVADIVKFMGMQPPPSTLLYPSEFINSIRDLNAGRQQAAAPAAASAR